jgi:coenzyme PQQ biosynthesis protein PqqD
MIGIESVVRLTPKARLKFDKHSQKHMLLYPEHGIVLSRTAADVLTLCVEARAVGAIVEDLVEKYGEKNREAIARDVMELLQGLADRGLVGEVGS